MAHHFYLQAVNGVVLATEKKNKSILFEDHSTYKIEQVTQNIGMVYSGMGPDYRLLVRRARKMAQDYYLMYHEPIPTAQLVYRYGVERGREGRDVLCLELPW